MGNPFNPSLVVKTLVALTGGATALTGPGIALAVSGITYTVNPQNSLVSNCSGKNAAVEQAADPTHGYI